jgi:hypothetical protein
MRNGQNKRMRGRNRNKGHHGGGHHHHHNPLTRVYESNGPDVKIRGTPHHIAEKYVQLARDAQASGDPVTAENHYQHAEHYFRLIAAAQEQFRQQNPYYQPQGQQTEGNRDDAFDDGDEDAGQPGQAQPSFGGQQPFVPREQPQPYQPQQQNRPQHQPQHQPYQPSAPSAQNYQAPQPHQQQPQFQPQPQPDADVSDGERLPSFVTRTQPQAAPQNFNQGNSNYDNQGGGDRFPRHRRRRHRGGGGPRPDMAGASQDFRNDDGPDDSRP